MNTKFEEWYDQQVTRINKMRSRLSKNPANDKLHDKIVEAEQGLFAHIVETGNQFEKFLTYDKEFNG